jgi:predicted nucleotidyltransferase component of viral defense system
MNLHENNETFKIFIENAAIYFDIKNRSIVEKDYYVTTFLKKLTKIQTDLIFKGGTSLSKAHRVIKRFSEDIDISLRAQADKPTNTQKRTLDENIKAIAKELGLNLNNPVNDPDRRDFIRSRVTHLLIQGVS